uniref:AIG1-type G domain-containing protein n=1 Tax=Biomphalaria glabrata TaxID=6526 RepID=A0A2C9JUJ5_BIOGL
MNSNVDTDFLLIGKLGQGRSATGNSILRNESFKSSSAMADVTANLDFDYAFVEGRLIKVVDTPGLRDLNGSSGKMKESFTKFLKCAVATNSKGYHVFLIVIRFGTRVTEEELNIVSLLKAEFGENFAKEFCIIAMTCGDLFQQEYGKENVSFQQWCQQQTGAFKQLLEECGGRIVLFDNKTTCESVRKKQVLELFSMVNQLRGSRFSQAFRFMLPSLFPMQSNETKQTGCLQDSSGGNHFSGQNRIEEVYKEISLVLKELKMYQHSLDNESDNLEKLITKLEYVLINLEKLVSNNAQQIQGLVMIASKTKRTISEEIKLQIELIPIRDEYTLNNNIRKCRYSEAKAAVLKRYSSLLAECPNDYDKQKRLSEERDVQQRRLYDKYTSEGKAAEDDFRNVIFEKRKKRMTDRKDFMSSENLEEEFRRSRTEYVRSFLSTLFNIFMRPFKYLYSKFKG